MQWQESRYKRLGGKRSVLQKLYTLTQVAEITGFSLGTVRQYVSNGVIPALYLCRKRVVQESVLERICTDGLRTKRTDSESTDRADTRNGEA